jgi:hypothetical protein
VRPGTDRAFFCAYLHIYMQKNNRDIIKNKLASHVLLHAQIHSSRGYSGENLNGSKFDVTNGLLLYKVFMS